MTAGASVRARARTLVIALAVAALAVVATSGSSPRAAAAPAALNGSAFGIELCPQLLCGAATFIGYFAGEVDGRPGGGWWMISIRHDDLPDAGADGVISGGRWSISTGGDRSTGVVFGGVIHNNGDDTFDIGVALGSSEPGTSPILFGGTLDHRVFPPTARGTLATRTSR